MAVAEVAGKGGAITTEANTCGACTFDNDVDATRCAMCSTPLTIIPLRGEPAIIESLFESTFAPNLHRSENKKAPTSTSTSTSTRRQLFDDTEDHNSRFTRLYSPSAEAKHTQRLAERLTVEHRTRNRHELIDAILSADVKLVESLLRGGASADTIDSLGSSALMNAAEAPNLDMVKLLFAHGANIDQEDAVIPIVSRNVVCSAHCKCF
jgi:hypothetical protein